ncbi:MAG: sulfur oxidation c-type cytochrome SoxA [Chromatiaceae bacterium]|nr:sulfur oxidation c-type cytochrome SoxA [Gammaproteobacteria bacterium]MCP5298183.1 sulfur oxidation c-type cytochrome SoxA [Chromatiaceae bacterium]MCP5423277.1 sulfur oxidation c-type cytochrome SoxA [Chromatiaceae bacterium]
MSIRIHKVAGSITAFALLVSTTICLGAPSPDTDLAKFQRYFSERFPAVPFDDFANGSYALDPVLRENWEAIEEFPPYETAIEEGREMWETPFRNGKSYADCFGGEHAIANRYPHWDADRRMVVTLPMALNECRTANGEEPLPYKKGKLMSVLAFVTFESRGQKTAVDVPAEDDDALAAYEKGKAFFYTRRGQLNLSCAHCHVAYPGQLLRSETLSPALGHTTHWPVYRSKWGEMGSLHRRFAGCNEQVRAKAFDAQGEEYRDLEYFLTYMNNGLPLNGPASRK